MIFFIDPDSGAITLGKTLDRETAGWHNITVKAVETGIFKLLLSHTDYGQKNIEPFSAVGNELCFSHFQFRKKSTSTYESLKETYNCTKTFSFGCGVFELTFADIISKSSSRGGSCLIPMLLLTTITKALILRKFNICVSVKILKRLSHLSANIWSPVAYKLTQWESFLQSSYGTQLWVHN